MWKRIEKLGLVLFFLWFAYWIGHPAYVYFFFRPGDQSFISIHQFAGEKLADTVAFQKALKIRDDYAVGELLDSSKVKMIEDQSAVLVIESNGRWKRPGMADRKAAGDHERSHQVEPPLHFRPNLQGWIVQRLIPCRGTGTFPLEGSR